MSALAQDLKTRGANNVVSIQSDLSNIEAHTQLLRSISAQFGDFDTVLVAYGTLGSQKKCEESFEETFKEINTNFLSVISILTPIANLFEKTGAGTIAVITSVAGDRGRKSNYIYGTAKGGVSKFLQGLRNRFGKTGVHVVDIKPGFTDTPMTADFPKGPLFVSPKIVGEGIVKAIDNKRNTAYIPWFWEVIMLIIKHIPEFIFKKLSL
jgi:short-subunit dehydrogenase